MDKLKEILKKIVFYINKFIKIILLDGIISDPKSFLVFKRLIIFAVLLFVLQGIIVTMIVFVTVKAGGESFVLPDVQGIDVFQAFNMLEKEGMNLNVQTHYFNNYPLGTVVSQEPKGGIKVKRGRTVYLVINVAEQALVKMPDVTGMKYEDAVNIINNNVITSMTNVKILPKVEVSDNMYENDVVLSQIPSPEDVVSMNTEIILTVNNKTSQEQ